MRIARRGLDLAVSEHLRDHGPAFVQRQRSRRKGVAEVLRSQAEEFRRASSPFGVGERERGAIWGPGGYRIHTSWLMRYPRCMARN